jgi:putative nucleotidyltransferase with HDIG domain
LLARNKTESPASPQALEPPTVTAFPRAVTALPRAVTAFIVALVAGAIALVAATFHGLLISEVRDLLVFFVLAALGEHWSVTITPNSRMSLSFPVHCAAAVLFGPAFAAGIAATGVLATDGLWARKSPSRLAFNAAQMALSAAAASLSYRWLGGGHPVSLVHDALPLAVAALAYLVVNDTLVAIVLELTGGDFLDEWIGTFRDLGLPWVAMAPLGALIASTYQVSPWALLYFPLLILVIYNGFKLYVTLQHETDAALVALADSIDKRDEYTFQHSLRVARLAEEIAARIGLSARETDLLVSAARVHDLGKIATDNRILFKQSTLTEDERRLIKAHSAEGGELAGRFSMFRRGRLYIRHHHERWAGSGSPDGLAGEEIPLGARIIAVADAYDAMTSDRPYRRSLPHEVAIVEIVRAAGKQFDPDVVKAFVTPQREDARVEAPMALPQESCSYS